MAAALGVERLDDLSARVAKLLDLRMPGSVFEKLRKLGDLFDLVKAELAELLEDREIGRAHV